MSEGKVLISLDANEAGELGVTVKSHGLTDDDVVQLCLTVAGQLNPAVRAGLDALEGVLRDMIEEEDGTAAKADTE